MIQSLRFPRIRFAPCSLLVLLAGCLWRVSSAWGALDPETTKPYHLQVVLRIAENRLLTQVFRNLVERELRDSLQAALGDLARVEIVRDHPLLKQVEAKGLQVALDGYALLSDSKTHFVLIDFIDGRYEIQARQYDGFTGLASPVVRHRSTADRQLVARSAALLVDQDFGVTGTMEVPQGPGDKVNVKLKGGGLRASLGHWLRKDQVFAVTQITRGSAQQQRSFRIPGTLVQVLEEPRGDVCRCRLLSRWENPLPQAPGVLGYRCLKLGTTRAPLRVRVVKEDKVTPVPAVQVQIGARGFDENSRLENTSTTQDGFVKSRLDYDNVAFVSIYAGVSPSRIPVEIIENQIIPCPVNVSAETVAQRELLQRHKQWVRRVYEGLEAVNSLFGEVNAMAGQSSESASARAQTGLKAIERDISDLAAEGASLRAESGTGSKPATLDLSEGETGLKELQRRRDELQLFITELQAIITKEKDPNRQKWKNMVAQARLQEEEAEFDKALQLYQQVLTEGVDTPALRKKVEALQRDWKPKNKEHEKARAFIYETWPKLETVAQINSRLPEARQAFLVCKEAGDILSPHKLLKTYVTQTDRLAKIGDALQPGEKEDDRETAKLIIELTPKLKEFNEQVKEYLRKAQPQAK